MEAGSLFELELIRRGIAFHFDPGSDDYLIDATGYVQLRVNLDHLVRVLFAVPAGAAEQTEVAAFVDAVLLAARPAPIDLGDVFWGLAPAGTVGVGYREAVSSGLDRVLTVNHDDGRLLRAMSPTDLSQLGGDFETVSRAAWECLDGWLRAASIHTDIVASGPATGALLAWLDSELPAKASLVLAPALREVVAPVIGWPILAIAPARDYLLLWSADRPDLTAGLATTVAREYLGSPYPLSPEVLAVSDTITTVGRYDL